MASRPRGTQVLCPKSLGTATAPLEELEWRFNNRKNPHIFPDTLRRILNTDRLRYKELVA